MLGNRQMTTERFSLLKAEVQSMIDEFGNVSVTGQINPLAYSPLNITGLIEGELTVNAPFTISLSQTPAIQTTSVVSISGTLKLSGDVNVNHTSTQIVQTRTGISVSALNTLTLTTVAIDLSNYQKFSYFVQFHLNGVTPTVSLQLSPFTTPESYFTTLQTEDVNSTGSILSTPLFLRYSRLSYTIQAGLGAVSGTAVIIFQAQT